MYCTYIINQVLICLFRNKWCSSQNLSKFRETNYWSKRVPKRCQFCGTESGIQLHFWETLREGVLSLFVSLFRFIPSSLGLADGSTLWLLLWNTKQRKCSTHCEGGKMTRGTLRHGCIDRWRERQRRERGPDKYVLSLQLSEEMLNKTSEACWSQKNTVFTSKSGFRRRRQSGQVETDQGLKWLLVLGLLCLLTYSSSVDECKAI